MTDTQRILDAVRKLVRLLRLADRAAQRDVGLSGAQLFVLYELGRAPEVADAQLVAIAQLEVSLEPVPSMAGGGATAAMAGVSPTAARASAASTGTQSSGAEAAIPSRAMNGM